MTKTMEMFYILIINLNDYPRLINKYLKISIMSLLKNLIAMVQVL
jgi:hypothetical protein